MLIILVAAILVIGVLVVSLLSVDTGADIVNFLGKLGSWLLEGLLYLFIPSVSSPSFYYMWCASL
jgi:hypothetical protein